MQTQLLDPRASHGSHRKTINERSRSRITEPSLSLSSSSSSSSVEQPIVGGIDLSPSHRLTNATCQSLRKRPRISDLQQHASTSRIPKEKHPAQTPNPLLNPPPKRRCASANPALRAQTRFTSPDRYVPQRPALHQHTLSFRTSKPPPLLQGREHYTRSRDRTRDPFRSVSDRSNEVARRRNGDHTYGLRFPHYTPSFVNGNDAGPFVVDPRPPAHSSRQFSSGGFWTVGGRGGAQPGHLHAVTAGLTGMLASGTNAPIHTPDFLDEPTRDDIIHAHEARLALAMDIDQATRVLRYTPPSIHAARTPQSGTEGIKWRDNSWTKDCTPRSEHSRRPAIVQVELR